MDDLLPIPEWLPPVPEWVPPSAVAAPPRTCSPGNDCCEECRHAPAAPPVADPIPGPYLWPPTMELRRSSGSLVRHLDALEHVVRRPAPPYRGIVWVGGGRYWPMIAAGVRLLREIGCTLPVEVWRRDSCEPVRAADVAGLNVEIVDADALASTRGDNRVVKGTPEVGGWEAKLYALTHTRFDQVLFLDADAYCVADPSPLFDLLTPEQPFAFWSDLPGLEKNVKWPRVFPGGERSDVPTVQGGQLLLDRRHAAKLLDVSHWMCQHSDYYFAHMFGDQDTWRVALAAGASGYRHLGPAPWRNVAFVCGYDGADYVVHRCRSKLFPGSPVRWEVKLPLEQRIRSHFEAVATSDTPDT